ncbi:MAG: SH3 domain-containing protein [Clostridia bacterium]|nr:SH3 domain-containing protein [Clostridia bacterium]
MSVLVGSANYDENGKTVGTTMGDQTGKEICTKAWYSKPWNVYLEPLDSSMAEKAATYMEQICADDNYGYSQNNRWTGYNSIVKNGKKVSGGKGDFDCSSLVLSCYILAGLGIAAEGYTGNMVSILVGTGKFTKHTATNYLSSDAYAQRGGIYVKEGSHTVMALGNGSKASASSGSSSSAGNTTYSGTGIGTAVAKCSMNIRSGAGTSYGTVGSVSTGTAVEVLEILSSGWYKIVWPGASCGYGYTSNVNDKYWTYTANSTASASSGSTSSGSSAYTLAKAQSFDKSLAGKYTTTASLNMRYKPGVIDAANVIQVIPKGKTVQNYGYYTTVSGVKWLYVVYNGQEGFCSESYLTK